MSVGKFIGGFASSLLDPLRATDFIFQWTIGRCMIRGTTTMAFGGRSLVLSEACLRFLLVLVCSLKLELRLLVGTLLRRGRGSLWFVTRIHLATI